MEIIFFIFGAIIASFVGVLSGRLNTGQGFFTGRSRCDACDATLPVFVLVPVLSFFFLHGRANCCKARLSPISPLVECVFGVLFVLSYLSLGLTLTLPFFLLSLSALLALVLYDLWHQILPTSLLVIFVAVSAATRLLMSSSPDAFYSSFVTALLIGTSLALVHFLSRGK